MLFDDDENEPPGVAMAKGLAVFYGTASLLLVSFVVVLAYLIYYVIL